MAYGIQIFNGSDVLQIDSDRKMSGLNVVNSSLFAGQSAGSTIPGTTVGFSPNLILINYSGTLSPGSAQYVFINKNTDDWSVVDLNGNPVNVDWAILEPFSRQTPSSSGYGIQIWNSSGELAFDSGLINNGGFTFKNYALPLTFSGNPAQDSGPLTTNLSEFVSVETSNYVPDNIRMGFLFANQYVIGGTAQTGIFFVGEFSIDFLGTGGQWSALGNISQIFSGTIGSV
jgi:hypothetical protein